MADAAAYEAQRRRQVEGNKRKLEELGLHHLFAAVVPPTAKPLRQKARAPTAAAAVGAPIRRSDRVADLPEQPNYREQDILGRKKSGVDAMVKANAMAKAKQLEAELGPGHPTFVKPMSQASSKSFILSLPVDFCRKHLPKRDEMISVVDEQDKKFEVKYHAVEYPRSSRWKGFITDHKLGDGDCLLFQLIQSTVFKVNRNGNQLLTDEQKREFCSILSAFCSFIWSRLLQSPKTEPRYTFSEQVLAKKIATDETGASNI